MAQKSGSWQADLDAGVSILTGRNANWSDLSLSLGRVGPESATAAQVQRARRFGRSEYLIGVRHERRIGRALDLSGGFAIGTDNRFLPDWRLDAGVSHRVSRTDVHTDAVRLGANIAHYSGGTFITLTPGAVRYFAARNAFVGIDAIALSAPDARWKFGVRGQAGVDLNSRLAVRAWLGMAPETERGRTEIVRSAALGVIVAGPQRRSFRLTLAGEKRAIGPDRVTISIGLTQKL
ncbi:MAG: YaiO family outer membrane beta-barrel protein [Pseudomonadota bacterium]